MEVSDIRCADIDARNAAKKFEWMADAIRTGMSTHIKNENERRI